MTETYETCLVDVADYVATVTIVLPPVNAQNGKFREEITRIFDNLGQRPDVRAIGLTGQGKLFSAGADLKDRPDARVRVASVSVPGSELMATALGIARQIASKSPLAVRVAKKSFVVTENLPLQEGYKFEQSQTAMLATTADFKEAQAAFREKRKPTF